MPSVPQNLSSHSIPQLHPSNPNNPSRMTHHDTPSHQAAPGITATASHTNSHVLPRRFLGQMPEAVVNSSEVAEKRQRLSALRGVAVRRLSALSESAAGARGLEGVERLDERRRRIVGRFKELKDRRASTGDGGAGMGEVDLDEDEEGDAGEGGGSGPGGWHMSLKGNNKKKKRKDVWVGESFDIGREFRDGEVRKVDDAESGREAVRDEEGAESMPPASPLGSQSVAGATGRASSSQAPSRAASAPADLDAVREDPHTVEREAGTADRPPAPSRATTQDTFVTARTRFSDAQSQFSAGGSTTDLPAGSLRQSTGETHDYELDGLPNGQSSSTSPGLHLPVIGNGETGANGAVDSPVDGLPRPLTLSPAMQPSMSRQSGTSSMHPLLSAPETPLSESPTSGIPPAAADGGSSVGIGKGKTRSFSPASPRTIGAFKGRLKSALRRPSGAPHTELADSTYALGYEGDEVGDGSGRARAEAARAAQSKAKTVQFPVDLNDAPGVMRKQGLKGNKQPANPKEVLAREGDEAEGTSAGAVEEAMADEEEEEWGGVQPGGVVMRDRVLVKVGYNREDNIMNFDEAMERRKPSRMEQMREYIIAWRKGRVEFYEEWRAPLKERLKGHKKLAYIVPLSSARSSLCVFNETDLTLSLTTSAAKLSDDLDEDVRSETTRGTGFRSRLRESRQAKWLLNGRRGTQIFLVKFAERSRALDWYWQLWRELGGELPSRLDIVVPAFSTTLRLPVPEDEYEVGGKATRAAMSPERVTQLAKEAIASAVDYDRLLQRRSTQTDLELAMAWKSTDGHLDWVNWDTTLQGKKRDWAVLAGLAKMQNEKQPEALQLRPASHRVKALKLQDGTVLDEPPGVEGYLTRHTGGSTPKEEIYASTHDGYIFIATKSNANPPLDPGKTGATPADIFPDVYDAFIDTEHRRMARLIEHCTGCVDLRDIRTVRLLTEIDHAEADADADAAKAGGIGDLRQKFKGKNLEHWFEVRLTHGVDAVLKSVVVEARDKEVAREWVECLNRLVAYWRHRHRVDARMRMDVEKMHDAADPFAGTSMSAGGDSLLSDMWDWCVLKGCRPICLSGRLFLRKGKWSKFRSRLIVLAGGCLIAFKVRGGEPLCTRKQRYPLYGAYTYSGLLAQSELHDLGYESAFTSEARVYQDGLQNTDGLEDRTFCVRLAAKPSYWGKERTYPWGVVQDRGWQPMGLSDQPPFLLVFRARSKLERDRWIWAINAELERQVRANVKVENRQREYGNLPA